MQKPILLTLKVQPIPNPQAPARWLYLSPAPRLRLRRSPPFPVHAGSYHDPSPASKAYTVSTTVAKNLPASDQLSSRIQSSRLEITSNAASLELEVIEVEPTIEVEPNSTSPPPPPPSPPPPPQPQPVSDHEIEIQEVDENGGDNRHNSQSTSSPVVKRRRVTRPRVSCTHESGSAAQSSDKPTTNQENESETNVCPICLDPWTNTGPHQVCCTPCGHLFGYSCLKEWIQSNTSNGNKSGKQPCPTCKHLGRVKDIRFLFGLPTRLSSADASLSESLKKQLTQERDAHNTTRDKLAEKQKLISSMRATIKELSRKPSQGSSSGVRTFGSKDIGGKTEEGNANTSGVPLKAKTSWIESGLQTLCTQRIEGDSVKAVFDSEARIIYTEKAVMSGTSIPGKSKLKRLDISRGSSSASSSNCGTTTSAQLTFNGKVRALSICPYPSSSLSSACAYPGYIAVAVAGRIVHVLSPELQAAVEVEVETNATAVCWLRSNPHALAVGYMTGSVNIYDMRFAGNEPLSSTQIDTSGWRYIHSLHEVPQQNRGYTLVAAAPKGVYACSLDRTPLTFDQVYGNGHSQGGNVEKICGVSISDQGKLVAITGRSTNYGDIVSVYSGLRASSNGHMELGNSLGRPLRGIGFDDVYTKAAVIEGYVGGSGGSSSDGCERNAVVACPDNVRQGGLTAWVYTRKQRNPAPLREGSSALGWEPLRVGGVEQHTGSPIRGVSAVCLPRSARLNNVPQMCRSLLAAFGDDQIRTFTCGRY